MSPATKRAWTPAPAPSGSGPDGGDRGDATGSAWVAAAARIALDVASYARGRLGRLVALTVRLPPAAMDGAFVRALEDQLRARGLSRPTVLISQGEGAPLLVSVEFARPADGAVR